MSPIVASHRTGTARGNFLAHALFGYSRSDVASIIVPRYHFNVFDGVTVLDREGQQLDDAQAARAAGLRIAGDLLRSEADQPKLGDDWRVEVTDGRGMILFRIDTVLNASPAASFSRR